jgi:hypothetical protein
VCTNKVRGGYGIRRKKIQRGRHFYFRLEEWVIGT